MNKNAQCFAGYWRNSLADAIFAKGGLDRRDIEQFIKCDSVVWGKGQISDELTKQLFQNKSNDCKTVEVVLRPKIYCNRVEHTFAKPKDIPEFVIPVATSALLTRNGKLYPLQNETIISRDILVSLIQSFFSIALANIERKNINYIHISNKNRT